jgi:hypothetical protein
MKQYYRVFPLLIQILINVTCVWVTMDTMYILTWQENIKMELKIKGLWAGLIWLTMGPVASSCEYDTERSGFIQDAEFLCQLSDYQLL